MRLLGFLAWSLVCALTGYALAVIAASARDLFAAASPEPNVVGLNAMERAALAEWPWGSDGTWLDPEYLRPDKAGA